MTDSGYAAQRVNYAHLPENLRVLRAYRRMSQAKLGALIGKSQTYVSHLESGIDPQVGDIDALASALGVTSGELLASKRPFVSAPRTGK